MKVIRPALTERDVSLMRVAFGDYLDQLSESGMEDTHSFRDAQKLIVRVSAAMERKLGAKYTQRFD